MATVVFSDLDGTLLDHHDYSWSGARTTLARIRRDGIPLVLVTSKTRAEVEALRRQLELDDPFVVENGGGAFFPRRYDHLPLQGAVPADGLRCLRFGVGYREVRDFVRGARGRVPMRGLGDMDDAEVAELTELDPEAARRARQREFTEPVVLEDPEDAELLERLARDAGLRVTRGGRFFHLMGEDQDKGRAVRAVRDALASGQPDETWTTIAAGDSPNDLPMLETVDIPVVIPHADGPHVEIEGATLAPRPGSHGWGEVIARILDGRRGGGA